MHPLAAAGSSVSDSFWTYLAVFALVMLGWAGIPGIGAAVLGAATAAASQGHLNLAAVLVVAVIAGVLTGSLWGGVITFVVLAGVLGALKIIR